jgi:hypothetical protein
VNLSCFVAAAKLRSWKLMVLWIVSYVVAAALAFIFPDWALRQDQTRDTKDHAGQSSPDDGNRANPPLSA